MPDASFRLWPFHLKPEADELFSSWVARLALAHGITVRRFLAEGIALPVPQMSYDIDRGLKPVFLERLAIKTASSLAHVERSTLLVYRPVLFPHNGAMTHWTWVRRYCTGLQFCPYCLYDDKIPYFRRHWRLSLFTVCEVHHQLLIEKCPLCGWSILPGRFVENDIHAHRIGSCWFCGYDLKSADPMGFSRDMISILAGFQKQVHQLVSTGLFFEEDTSHVNPAGLFRRLRGEIGPLCLKFIEPESSSTTSFHLRNSVRRKRIFESLPADVRARALVAAQTKWPTGR